MNKVSIQKVSACFKNDFKALKILFSKSKTTQKQTSFFTKTSKNVVKDLRVSFPAVERQKDLFTYQYRYVPQLSIKKFSSEKNYFFRTLRVNKNDE